MDELIVFLMHQYSWTLEYTVDLVNTLPLKKLRSLVKETLYQQASEDYKTARNFAMLLANWATAQGKKKYRVTDFIGNPPRRENYEGPDIKELARQKGIIMPEGDS